MGRGRKGGRGGGRGGGDGGGFSDQYGEAFVSQDRDQPFSFGGGRGGPGGSGGGGMKGGGEAGSRSSGPDLKPARHIPKFLQAHAHLLSGRKDDTAPTLDEAPAQAGEAASDDEDIDGEALQRAMAENPELAVQHPQLIALANKGKAAAEKELGNRAFKAGSYEAAAKHFTTCIELDPRNEVYYSNRAAALTALKRYDEALQDGRRVVGLKPDWAKGYARVGAAYFGLEDWSEAKEAYARALTIEPDDQALLDLHTKAVVKEEQAAEAHKHKFKRRWAVEGGGGNSGKRGQDAVAGEEGRADGKAGGGKKPKTTLLSFDDEEG